MEREEHRMKKVFRTSERTIDNTGKTHVTEELQRLIDEAAGEKGTVILEKGVYLTAALFLKSDMELHFEDGAVLLGSTDESRYTPGPTRAAGIETQWYPGVLNCDGQRNVTVSGNGVIDGQGAYWWDKYWGADKTGGMRKEYDAKGLRWACDYDCMRVRNVVVSNSSHIELRDFTSTMSGFWNVHIFYSDHVHVDGVRVVTGDVESPSTDGIDIDSCQDVLVENCVTSCHDDSICIKSGRDADGIRVGRPCCHITVQNCEIRSGFGVTIGSEVSGGIYDITLRNLRYRGTDCGFRIKSSIARKGYIRDVRAENLEMVNVKYPFHWFLNWNPAYSWCELPQSYEGEVPALWKKLLDRTYMDTPDTDVSNITVDGVKAWNEPGYEGISRAFHIEGFEKAPIRDVVFKNMQMECREYGVFNYTKNIRFENVSVSASGARDEKNDVYDNR